MTGTQVELHVKAPQDLPPLDGNHEPPNVSVHGRFIRKRNLSYVGNIAQFLRYCPMFSHLLSASAAAKVSCSATSSCKMEVR